MQPGRACRTHGRRRRKVLLLCGDVRLTTAPKLRSLMLRQLATTPAAQHDHARRIIAHSIITATCRPTTATQTHALQSCDCCTLPVHRAANCSIVDARWRCKNYHQPIQNESLSPSFVFCILFIIFLCLHFALFSFALIQAIFYMILSATSYYWGYLALLPYKQPRGTKLCYRPSLHNMDVDVFCA